MNNQLSKSDDELLLLLAQSDQPAFKQIYNRYWEKLYNFAYKRLHQSDVCEEIIQEVFTKLWQNRTLTTITTGLSNYLFTAVRYNVVDHYRRQLLRDNYAKDGNGALQVDNSTEENVFLHDLQTQVDRVIAQLPDKCRNVYLLSRFEHKTNKEIAQLLNISEKTVEGHITKALQQLRLELVHFLPVLLLLIKK